MINREIRRRINRSLVGASVARNRDSINQNHRRCRNHTRVWKILLIELFFFFKLATRSCDPLNQNRRPMLKSSARLENSISFFFFLFQVDTITIHWTKLITQLKINSVYVQKILSIEFFFLFFLEILNQVANKSWFRWHAVTRDFTKSKSSTPVKLSAARESPWIGFWKMRNMLAPRYFFPRRDIERERERESSKICRYFNQLCFQGISSSHPRPPPFPLYPFLFIHHHS